MREGVFLLCSFLLPRYSVAEDAWSTCWVGDYAGRQHECCDRTVSPRGREECFSGDVVFETCCKALLPRHQEALPRANWALTVPCPPLPGTCYTGRANYTTPRSISAALITLSEFANLNTSEQMGLLWVESMRFILGSSQLLCIQEFPDCFAPVIIRELHKYVDVVTNTLASEWGANLNAHVGNANRFNQKVFLAMWHELVDRYEQVGAFRFNPYKIELFNFPPAPESATSGYRFLLPSEVAPAGVCDLSGRQSWPWFVGDSLEEPSSPKTADVFNAPWIDVSGLLVRHASILAIFRHLTKVGIDLSHKLINVGAHDGSCGLTAWAYDPANCMAHWGWGGIMFEAEEMHVGELRARFARNPEVSIVDSYVRPETIADLIRKADPNIGDVDLVKLDIDRSECLLLEPIFQGIGLPKVLHVEIMALAPPEISYSEIFDRSDTIRGFDHSFTWCCSIGGFLDVLGDRYRLLQVEFGDAVFLRSDLVQFFPHARRHPTAIWHVGFFCHPFSSLASTDFPFDARALGDEALALSFREDLLRHALNRVGYGENQYTLRSSLRS